MVERTWKIEISKDIFMAAGKDIRATTEDAGEKTGEEPALLRS